MRPGVWGPPTGPQRIAQALIVDDSDARSKHWNDSARALLKGIILLTLTLDASERNLISVRELLLLSYPPLVRALREKVRPPENGEYKEQFYNESRAAVETLLRAMSRTKPVAAAIAWLGDRGE